MSFSIIWSPRAILSFDDRIKYLEIHWTDKEITNFRKRVKEYLEILKEKPFIGKKPGKLKNIYIGLIIKQVSLIYRIKLLKMKSNWFYLLIIAKTPKRSRSINLRFIKS